MSIKHTKNCFINPEENKDCNFLILFKPFFSLILNKYASAYGEIRIKKKELNSLLGSSLHVKKQDVIAVCRFLEEQFPEYLRFHCKNGLILKKIPKELQEVLDVKKN